MELVRAILAAGAANVIVVERATKSLVRRAKHSRKIMRYRHKKKATFADMQAEERALMASLQVLLAVKDAPQADKAARYEALMELLVLKEGLHEEQVTLRQK